MAGELLGDEAAEGGGFVVLGEAEGRWGRSRVSRGARSLRGS